MPLASVRRPAADPDPAVVPPMAPHAGGWRARLDLRFALGGADGQQTVLAHRLHVGPLAVQRAFYPEADGTCHVYLLHPPGGMAGGDEVMIDATAEPGTSVLLTTPAAGKIYRTAGETSRVTQLVRAARDARMEWLPQETIVFGQCAAEIMTAVHLEEGAQFTGWEVLCFGRPAAGDRFAEGRCGTRWEVHRAGQPLLLERGRYAGDAEIMGAPWGLAGFPVSATLVATATPDAVPAAREAVGSWNDGRFGCTWLNGLLVARCLSHHADAARRALIQVWHVLRRAQGRQPVLPRIWST